VKRVLLGVSLSVMMACAAVAQVSKFVPAGVPAMGMGHYRVTLGQTGQPDALTAQLVAMCRCRQEPYAEEGFSGFVVLATPSAARVLSLDPRVRLVEEISADGAAAPAGTAPPGSVPARGGGVIANATTSWTTGTYTYDGSGNIKTMGPDAFTYDLLGRVSQGTVSGYTQAYTYDRYGNITKMVTTGTSDRNYTIAGTTNRLSSTQGNALATYDSTGRMLTLGGNVYTFTYDAADMVSTSTGPSGRLVYLYSASDERLAAITVNASNQELQSEWTVRAPDAKVLRRYKRIGGVWSWDEDYIYRDGQLLAAEVAGPAKTLHFHPDHLGTPRLVTGAGGTKVAVRNFYPFGEELPTSSIDSERMKFTGHERDSPSIDYMHARYYDPQWGRFLLVDPSRDSAYLEMPQSWNRYSYVMNNPLKYTDPTGRIFKCETITKDDGSTEQICSEEIEVDATDPKTTPRELGWEWLSGTGPRDRQFTDGDKMTEMLKRHPHVQEVARQVCDGALPPEDTAPYKLSGLAGVPKYLRDYSTLATGGLTGNLAVTYLGSFGLSYAVSNGEVNMHVTNSSSAASALRPPVIGYTQAWQKNIGSRINQFFSSGPMSKTTQEFNFSVPCQ